MRLVEQRIGRVQRLASQYKYVTIFNITLSGTFEDFIVGRLMEKLLYGVSPTDPFTFGLAVGFLILVCLAATYLPARQASEIDPSVILRAE